MSELRAALRRTRGRVYTVLPLLPVEERWLRLRHRAVIARRRALEDAEVQRLRAQLGRVPAADVVTVIATYDRPERVPAAVAGALAQTVADHLVVVVNDGGRPPALPADPRLLVVSLSANSGSAPLARNVAIRLTDSRLVAFCDDDCTWLPDHLAHSLAAHGPGVDLTYTDEAWVGPDGEDHGLLARPDAERLLPHTNHIDMNSIVVRRSAQARLSLVPRTRASFAAEDWELAWRHRGRIRHVPGVTVHYLVNPDSTYSLHEGWLPTSPAGRG